MCVPRPIKIVFGRHWATILCDIGLSAYYLVWALHLYLFCWFTDRGAGVPDALLPIWYFHMVQIFGSLLACFLHIGFLVRAACKPARPFMARVLPRPIKLCHQRFPTIFLFWLWLTMMLGHAFFAVYWAKVGFSKEALNAHLGDCEKLGSMLKSSRGDLSKFAALIAVTCVWPFALYTKRLFSKPVNLGPSLSALASGIASHLISGKNHIVALGQRAGRALFWLIVDGPRSLWRHLVMRCCGGKKKKR